MKKSAHKPALPTTWIVIADRRHARILQSNGSPKAFVSVAEMKNTDLARNYIETVSDRQGYFRGPVGVHAGEPEVDYRHQTADNFAKQVVDHLEHGRQHGEFSQLALVAAPLFLGALRSHLTPSLAQMIVWELDRDYTNLSDRELQEHLPEGIGASEST